MPKKSQKAAPRSDMAGVPHANGTSKRNDINTSTRPIEMRAVKVDTLKELRKASDYTQDDLAHAMGVGQGTVSRIEKRRDMLVSTLQHYVESMGGELQILATFPNRPPLVVECLSSKSTRRSKERKKKPIDTGATRQSGP